MTVGRLKFLGLYVLIAVAIGIIGMIGYLIGAAIYDPSWFDSVADKEPQIPMVAVILFVFAIFIAAAVAQTLLYAARLRDIGWDVLWASYIPLSYMAILATFAYPQYGTGITLISSIIGIVFFLLLLFVPGKKVEVA